MMQEVIVLMGYPGAGKTTYAEEKYKYNSMYVILHRDGLKNKMRKSMIEALDYGKSVVIDATNPSRSCRKTYIDIAKERGIDVKCIHIDTNNQVANNRNRNRINKVPNAAYRQYTMRYEKPTTDEGFSIVSVIVPK
eukprot:762836-Hanusia_phi.AAC.4